MSVQSIEIRRLAMGDCKYMDKFSNNDLVVRNILDLKPMLMCLDKLHLDLEMFLVVVEKLN